MQQIDIQDHPIKEIRIADKKDQLGNPGPALTFIFTMLTMEFWGIYAGIFTGPTIMAVGMVQIACFIPYLIGAILYYCKGDSTNGNVFLIFATLFGGVGGLTNITIGVSEIMGWPISTQMTALPFILGGISILPVVWINRASADKVTVICYMAAACFLTFTGLVSLNILNTHWNLLLQWLGLIVTITGLYSCINGLLLGGRSRGIPVGKPFFK
ncbi:hypothetical protein [Paenibacillus sp. FSL R7-0179]|uniref:hypothetical protein n=1 Tax=Paenibacillus sp. FSL R7-0179 TaxID=2921672 RepID=UPI0030F6983F